MACCHIQVTPGGYGRTTSTLSYPLASSHPSPSIYSLSLSFPLASSQTSPSICSLSLSSYPTLLFLISNDFFISSLIYTFLTNLLIYILSRCPHQSSRFLFICPMTWPLHPHHLLFHFTIYPSTCIPQVLYLHCSHPRLPILKQCSV